MSNATRVMLTGVRLAFPVLEEPEQFQGQGKPRYSATLLMERDSANHKAILAAMEAAANEKWPGKGPAAVKGLFASGKTALVDGNTKEQYDGFEDKMALGAHSQASAPPRLLDGQKNELPRNTGVIYPGCYVNASVEIWAQDNQYGKRLNAQLRGVQFAAAGDSFAAGTAASPDEFDVVEGAVAGNGDFGNDESGDFA